MNVFFFFPVRLIVGLSIEIKAILAVNAGLGPSLSAKVSGSIKNANDLIRLGLELLLNKPTCGKGYKADTNM